jgi:hypothetical protein
MKIIILFLFITTFLLSFNLINGETKRPNLIQHRSRHDVINSIIDSTNKVVDLSRSLIGTNCVVIERGEVPKYYKCVGCVIEEAQLCVDDMRLNRTGNVFHSCEMRSAMEFYKPEECCPQQYEDKIKNYDLNARTTAYPDAFTCLKKVGCDESTIYNELLRECETVCKEGTYLHKWIGYKTDKKKNPENPCFAYFNAGISYKNSYLLSIIMSTLLFLFMSLL